MEMTTYRCHKAEIDVDRQTRMILEDYVKAARWVYNWGLARIAEALQNRRQPPSIFDLSKELTRLKHGEHAWLQNFASDVIGGTMRDLQRDIENYYTKMAGGQFPEFPRPRTPQSGPVSFRVGRIRFTRTHVRLPRIGMLPLKTATPAYVRNYQFVSATITEKDGVWSVTGRYRLVIDDEEESDW